MKLTLPQQDVYYEQLLYPDEPIYNIGAKIIIKGRIDYKILNDSFIALIDQHDAYRSIIIRDQENVEMQILSKHKAVLEFYDFSKENNPDEHANQCMQKMFTTAFDLHAGKLLHKFVIIKITDDFHYLFSMYHHIITDGWGTSLMFQRWVKNYNELKVTGKLAPDERYTYNDFAVDDAKYIASAEFEDDKRYWKNKFQQLPERLFSKINQQLHINKSKRKELIVPRSFYNQLEAMAVNFKCTTFHVILASLYLYLGRRYQNKDFAIGLPVLNRSKAAFKKTVGLFMGVTTLRMQFSFEDTFEQLVNSIKQQLRQDYRHQRLPLGKLIQELDVFREKDRLFNMTLSYEKQNYADHFVDTNTSVIPLTHGAERVALAIYIREFDASEDVKIDFDYHVNYFDEATISNITAHFEQLLQGICADPLKKLHEYEYLKPDEKIQILDTFNQTQREYPRNTTLISYFKKQVQNNREQMAVSDDTDRYSYQELDELSDHIANQLLAFPKIRTKAPVAVLMPRSANLVATLLGILKTGTAYIPLDPDFPQARLEYIVSHSQVACIIGTTQHRNTIGSDAPFICIDDINNKGAEKETFPELNASETAYIIYTSGSTGKPKGVEITNRSLLNFLLSMQQTPGITANDVFFSVTTQSFDISILEFFAPLISGAQLYMAPKQLQADPAAMIAKLEMISPSIIQATPSFYQLLYNAGWKGSKHLKILCGGDLLSVSLAEKLLATCAEIWNMYGPTETTIWSSVKKIIIPEDATCIGKPIHNTRFYILDEYLNPLPVDCPGAIYIGGDGLAKGYYKNEALTTEKFILSPFHTNEKIYETGDVGQWTAQGEIRFLGRNDNQVKIRGYRIELGEIETKLNQLPAVKLSVVIANKKTAQEAFLVAYVILQQEVPDTRVLISMLQKELPVYMIPHIIIPVTEFPLTPNNKIDRKALAAMEVKQLNDTATHVDPETSVEVKLCCFFKETLEWDGKVGITDNFFSLGGDSLNAMRVVNQIQKQLYYQLSLRDIFNNPTVQELANYISTLKTIPAKGIVPTSTKPFYPVSPGQYAIWLAAQQGYQRSASYNMFVVYEINGEIDPLLFEQCFIALINKHEVLRTNVVEQEGIPYQKVNPSDGTSFRVDRFTVTDSQTEKALQEYVNKTFDLANDLLLRVGLFKTENSYLLAFSSHHIILDGWSMGVLIKEVSQYYSTSCLQNEFLPFQFRDYVCWLQETTLETQERNSRFWKEYLLGYQPKTILPSSTDGTKDKYLAGEYNFQWKDEFFESLKANANEQKSTLYTFLLTAFLTLLHKIADETDLCIGVIKSGRTTSDLDQLLGMFVKTLPLRAKFNSQQTFSAQLKTIHHDLMEIDLYQDLPESATSKQWFDILFVLQPPLFNYDLIELDKNRSLELFPLEARYNRIPLLINFIEAKEELRCTMTYDASKYDKETIELLFLRYENLLSQLLTQPDITTDGFDIKLAFEKEQVIEIDFNF